jgi:hypothetical protein
VSMKIDGRLLSIVRWFEKTLHIDVHIFQMLLFRLWTVLAGVGTVVFVSIGLTPIDQGYYYTFNNILALQMFFELGLNQVISQMASHEARYINADVGLNNQNINRLAALVHLIRRWYSWAAFGFFVFTGIGGILFFINNGNSQLSVWFGPWILIVLGTAINLWVSPRLAILEGLGKVADVAKLRVVQSIFGYLGLWLLLFCEFKLWAVPVLPLILACISVFWIQKNKSDVAKVLTLKFSSSSPGISWRHDVFPLQWRTAISWVSSFLVLNLFVPVVFRSHGASEAGKLGMALTIFASISAVGMSWISARAPFISQEISSGNYLIARAYFKKAGLRSVQMIFTVSILFVFVVYAATIMGFEIANRLSPIPVLIVICATTLLNGISFVLNMYIRAHKVEPTWPIGIFTSLLTLIGLFLFKDKDILFLMIMYFAISGCISFPLIFKIYTGYSRKVL